MIRVRQGSATTMLSALPMPSSSENAMPIEKQIKSLSKKSEFNDTIIFSHDGFITAKTAIASSVGENNIALQPLNVQTELEGTWAGTNTDGIDQTQWTYIMALDSIVIQADAQEKYRGAFTLDTAASPKRITIAITKSSTASSIGKKILALYGLSGNILKITANDPGSSRPSNMDPPVSVITLILQ